MIRSLTTSAKFTSMTNTCSTMSGVYVRESDGNTFEFIKLSLMYFTDSINIIIITKRVII